MNKNKRIHFIKIILDSFDDEDSFELRADQLATLDERWATVENGTATLVSLEEVQDRLNKKYGFNLPLS